MIILAKMLQNRKNITEGISEHVNPTGHNVRVYLDSLVFYVQSHEK